MIRYGRKNCKHDWVNRTDGYEEQCGAAVCLKCGAFTCWCEPLKEYHGIGWFDEVGLELKKKVMIARGVAGNANTNGKWKNPYVGVEK